MSELLKRAQSALDQAQTNDRYRPCFHLSVPVGWLNDPNGFVWCQGRCHLFYQFHPYNSVWGPMHWGHWSSADLLNWRVEPVAIAPDEPYDKKGCFSGTALEYDCKMIIVYTGVCEEAPNGKCIQQQCIAESTDCVHYRKIADNPVIGRGLLPEDVSPYDFRDPKIEKTAEGFRVLTAARGSDGGQLLTFTSPDLKSWTCAGALLRGIGDMIECPDYFELDDKYVFILSVMGVQRENLPHHQSVVYLVGEENNERFVTEYNVRAVDWGLDFYAPQTTRLPDGRRIMVGWAQRWGHEMATHRLGHGWSGTMTCLRECSLIDGKLLQKPIREYQTLRGALYTLPPTLLSGVMELSGMAGANKEIELSADMTNASALEIRLMQTGEEYFSVRYIKKLGWFTLDRSNCSCSLSDDDIKGDRLSENVPFELIDGKLSLRILIDVSVIEVFVGDGELVMTSMAFPRGTDYGVSVVSEGESLVEIKAWDMARPQ